MSNSDTETLLRNVLHPSSYSWGELCDIYRKLDDVEPDALTPLLAALDSSEMEMRLAALDAYERLGDPRSVKPLMKLLKH